MEKKIPLPPTGLDGIAEGSDLKVIGNLIRDAGACRQIPVNAIGLAGESGLQAFRVHLPSLGNVKVLIADVHVIVAIRIQLKENKIVGHTQSLINPAHVASGTQIANVVDTGTELVPPHGNRVPPSPGQIVLLKHHDSFVRPGQSHCRGHATRPGANHNDICILHCLSTLGQIFDVALGLLGIEFDWAGGVGFARAEGALGRGNVKKIVLFLEGELGTGHDGIFAEPPLEHLQGVVDCAPALGVRAAPQGRLGVEPLQVGEAEADLPNRLLSAAHGVPVKLLHDLVDDGVAKLRMLKPVLAAGALKITEPNADEQFPRLQPFAAELAGQPRGFAQQKNQSRVVVRLVNRQRGAAGDGGAVLLLHLDRFGPFAAGEQPQLLPPDAEAFAQEHRRHPGHVAERVRAERGQRTLAPFSAAGEFAQRPVGQKLPLAAGRDFAEPRLGRAGCQLGRPHRAAQAGRHRHADRALDLLAQPVHVIRRRRLAPDVALHRGEIQKALVDRRRQQRRRVPLHHAKHVAGDAAIVVVVRLGQDAVRAEAPGLEAGGASLDAEALGQAVGGDDDTVAFAAAADPHRSARERRVHGDLATGEKRVAIDMQDAELLSLGHSDRECRNRAGPGQPASPGRDKLAQNRVAFW